MHDLVIRNGTIVDGTGAAPQRADLGISQGKVAEIGALHERGAHEIDAQDLVVTPGFIDAHTHMDAQVFWDPLGTSSCWHGVTSVVMGNCGFTIAPSHHDQRHLVISNLERAEDIPKQALTEGVDWSFETFPDFLDTVEALPKAINFGGYVGHSALRTWAMGERAFASEASEEDLCAMEEHLRTSLHAGALGFSTSRSSNHRTMEGTPVASVLAPWTEVSRLVGVLGDCGSGVFQLAREQDAYGDDREVSAPHSARMIALAAECRRPVTFGVVALTRGRWRTNLELVEEAARTPGADIFGQCEVNESAILVSFETRLPFDRLPVWRELRSQSLGVQATLLDNPELRERLVRAAEEGPYQSKLGTMASRPDFDWIRVLRNPLGPNPTVADVARERGVHPVAAMIDVAREQGLQQFFQQIVGNRDPAAVEELVTHPRIVPTFTDSGAHVSQVMNASLHTYLLAHWVRERGVLSLAEAVRRITSMPAEIWGLGDRGLLKPGWIADVNIIDPTTVAPLMPSLVADLPGGSRRIVQRATGIHSTIVAGRVVFQEGLHTGDLPGRLIRASSGG